MAHSVSFGGGAGLPWQSDSRDDREAVVDRALRPLALSLFFFASVSAGDPSRKYDLLMRCVELADHEGMHAVWIPERHFSDFGALFPNPSVVGAAIAATTRRIGICAGSVVAPLHDPLRLVEEWSVVDNLSGGRVGISLASGWNPDDFVFSPNAYARRRESMAESIGAIRSLWSGGAVSRLNGVGATVEVRPRPRPLQEELPLWLTVVRAEGFQHAADLGTNVLTGLMELREDELAGLIARYRANRRGAGRPRVTMALHTYVDAVPGRARHLAHEPLANYLGAYVDGGHSALAQRNEIASVVGQISSADRKAILWQMAERYLTSRSMIGAPSEVAGMCRRMAGAGVDEIACLVDFGLPSEVVLSGMEELLRVRDRSAAGGVLA